MEGTDKYRLPSEVLENGSIPQGLEDRTKYHFGDQIAEPVRRICVV